MPKRVDHEERRRQIADALLRTAAARGLHAAGMREVAAEAGVSLRLVQYYFGTKEELMLAGMQHLAAQFGQRAMARIKKIKETEAPVSPRDIIAAILTEGLPVDDERRTFTVLYTAYFALSLSEPALAIAPLVRNSNVVIDVVATQLRAAQAAGDTPADLDPDLEALGLLALSAGLGTSVLGGQSSAEQAQAVIDYHLDRLFSASRPALRPGVIAHDRRGHGRSAQVSAGNDMDHYADDLADLTQHLDLQDRQAPDALVDDARLGGGRELVIEEPVVLVVGDERQMSWWPRPSPWAASACFPPRFTGRRMP